MAENQGTAGTEAATVAAPQPVQPPNRFIGLLTLLLGVLAFAAPLIPGRAAFTLLGLTILFKGILERAWGAALDADGAPRSWFARGGGSMATGVLLLLMPKLTFTALALLLGVSWIVSGVTALLTAFRGSGQEERTWQTVDGLANILLGAAIAVQWPLQGIVSIGWLVGLRCLSSGWSMLLRTPRYAAGPGAPAGLHPNARLGLAPHPYIGSLCEELAGEEKVRSRSDRGWRWLFLATFFAIHASRMDTDWNLVGILTPFGAVLGDVLLAIVLGYFLVAPVTSGWRFVTRGLERRAWTKVLARVDEGKTSGLGFRLRNWWVTRRLRTAVRTGQARGSATAALGWGLQAGLPMAALLIAVTPLWGVSWMFNTETWVAGAWEMWAEQRTDVWRTAMVDAVKEDYGEAGRDPNFFRVSPDGVAGAKDFSFIVIGDTGEGDASQHILRDQLWEVGQKPEVKFLVLSSDVIYPSGTMRDYEPKFYLPFKGFRKPIYAVPGNHDWYDALEAFTANFLEPQAATAALRGRRGADYHLTTTTEAKIDSMVREAALLRQEYQIQSARQRAPYFEMHAERFSLVAVDTGILRRVDDAQMRWLEEALGRAQGKFTMVILGHPLYAAGHYQGQDEPDFAKIHAVLKKHRVDVVMAGDTHDFEFYREIYQEGDQERSMYHFVNGGGGAYLSIGTALDWPRQPPVKECGFYPRADRLTEALNTRTASWKWPLWLWVRDLNAWPSSPEAVASAFNYDRAPFFQSFMEVRVEPSSDRVRLLLHGVNGRLLWRDLHVQDDQIPNGQRPEGMVEFSFGLREKKTP